jgi:hypothetical protein
MAAAIACVPTSPVSTSSACRITVTGADQNTSDAPNTSNYPVQDEMRYYLTFELGGEIMGKSYVFGVSDDGTHVFNNYVFPDNGSWTIRLNDASDDSSVQTQAVTVS